MIFEANVINTKGNLKPIRLITFKLNFYDFKLRANIILRYIRANFSNSWLKQIHENVSVTFLNFLSRFRKIYYFSKT
ncbi:hypothetical protein GCM10022389_05850 [Flavobacterium cheonanense]|uniref:Uncharacterized protein n=1 Tax=Flavobacterium cheonanense TaxID=706183 RepID=A0ABP7VCA6_9FLAO